MQFGRNHQRTDDADGSRWKLLRYSEAAISTDDAGQDGLAALTGWMKVASTARSSPLTAETRYEG